MIVPHKIRIVHLDDHTLFQEGVRRCLLHLTHEFELQQYQYSHHAFDAIKGTLFAREPIHLIITDMVHMGQDGYEFAKSVRQFEAEFFVRIPILLLSVQSPKYNKFTEKGLEERVFDAYLPKNASCAKIHETIAKLTQLEFRPVH